jgi:hypothetical protein
MGLLHDPEIRSAVEKRLAALTADARPRWGKMSVDQMLWHVNQAMGVPLGETALDPKVPPIPKPIIKFLVLHMPWTKGAPTNAAFIARKQYDFATERARCSQLIARLTARPLEGEWPYHRVFGKMSGRDYSKLHAIHLDHHFKQFGV